MTYFAPALPVFLVALALGLYFKKRSVAVFSAAALFAWSWPPFACLVAETLERRCVDAPLPSSDAQAIVVLSSAVEPASPEWAQPSAGHGTYLRCRHAAWLHKHWRTLPVLASGGHVQMRGHDLSLSRAMAEALQAEGVPAGFVWTEDRSTSTYENALYSANVLRSRGIRRIVLVTEAYHMPRAASCFRKQGFNTVEAPCDFRLARFKPVWLNLLPTVAAFRCNDDILHEWLGLLWYKIAGRI